MQYTYDIILFYLFHFSLFQCWWLLCTSVVVHLQLDEALSNDLAAFTQNLHNKYLTIFILFFHIDLFLRFSNTQKCFYLMTLHNVIILWVSQKRIEKYIRTYDGRRCVKNILEQVNSYNGKKTTYQCSFYIFHFLWFHEFHSFLASFKNA